MLEKNVNKCDNCGSKNLVVDEQKGEVICSECGSVVEDSLKDLGPDWTDFRNDKETSKRAGPPTDPLQYDRGLTTQIQRKLVDGKGKSLKPEQRRTAFKLRRTERRSNKKDGRERSLAFAIVEIEKIASSLSLSRRAQEKAANLYRKASEAELIRGRSREGMATASIYAACRLLSIPRTMEEIAQTSVIDRKEMRRSFLSLSRNLELDIPPVDPAQYIHKYSDKLNLSIDTINRAQEILEKAKEKSLVGGRNPRGIIGAVIYLASKNEGEERTQKSISETVNVTEVTIRNRFREIGTELDIPY